MRDMTRERFSFGHKPIFKSPPEAVTPAVVRVSGDARDETPKAASTQKRVFASKNSKAWTLRQRGAILLAMIAVPAMAAPDDFGQLPGGAPTEAEMVREQLRAELKRNPAMPFERPGMSFPGSAFFFLAEPPPDALIALPELDALAEGVGEAGRELGEAIDVGPGASPFFTAGGANHTRAQSCLAQAIWYEAANESEAGQRAVAQVVLNRVTHPSWPSSVCGVVYQGSSRRTGCQFTFTCDGSLKRKARGQSWVRAQSIASEALSGNVYEPIGHATHYHTLWVNPYWAASLDHVGTIGAHRFYRNKGAGGRKDAFTQSYTGIEPGVSDRIAATSRAASVGDQATPARVLDQNTQLTPSASAMSNPPISGVQAGQSAATIVGPGSIIADPALTGAGQVREGYAQAGQWKNEAARAALLEEQRRNAQEAVEQNRIPR